MSFFEVPIIGRGPSTVLGREWVINRERFSTDNSRKYASEERILRGAATILDMRYPGHPLTVDVKQGLCIVSAQRAGRGNLDKAVSGVSA